MNALGPASPYMHSETVHPTNSNPDIRLTHSESPLDTLVRRTSSRKIRNRSPHSNQTHIEQRTQTWEPYQPQQLDVGAASSSTSPRRTLLPSPQKPASLLPNLDQDQTSIAPDTPHSPLLHSHFPARGSVLSGTSYHDDSFDGGSQADSLAYDGDEEHPRFSPVDKLGDSSAFQSGSNGRGLNAGVQQNSYAYQGDDRSGPIVNRASDVRHSEFLDYYLDCPGGGEVAELTVIVSSPDNNPSVLRGRAPVIRPVMANFSRPMPDSGQWHRADAIAERVTPQLPPQMREQKKAVLERNAIRNTKTASIVTATNSYKPSHLSTETTAARPSKLGHKALAINTAVAQPAVVSPYINSIATPGSSVLQLPSSGMRAVSPSSLYSNYSYYHYDGLIPSPVLTGSSNADRKSTPRIKMSPTDNRVPSSMLTGSTNPDRGRPPSGMSPNDRVPSSVLTGSSNPDRERPPSSTRSRTENMGPLVHGPRTAQDFLLLGIEHHEAYRLHESARCFERSAKEGGGCGVGMLMYGLSLRHGWGCPKNEALGFKWVRKAAESAVEDLEQLRIGKANIDQGSIQAELVLAIYEVGQCFFHGWGVVKDQKMGFSYYMVAAQLGDGDAQGDLAFCLVNGKGCKKNKKEAARWYRAAVQQGQSDVGLAWIYKDKYQD